MQNSRSLFALFIVLLVMLIPNISVASTLNATSNSSSSNSLNVASVATSNSLQALSSNSLKYVNQTVITKTFNDLMKPVSGYITYIVLFIFIIVLAYGLIEIYGEMNIEPEKKLRAMLEYAVGASSILLIAVVLYAYAGYFPQIVASTAPNLINVHSVIPFELILFDLFIAVIISIFGFILAMKELLTFIRTFQPTLHSETKEFERNSALTRFLLLIAFAFFSPLLVGLLFVILTQVFFSVSTGVSTALTSVAYNASNFNLNSVSAQMYVANTNFNCGANIFSGGFWTCLGSNLLYIISANSYSVGYEAIILNIGINLMLSPFGTNWTFMLIYDLIIMILYVYAFAKIDYYSLQYVSSLKTGEKEAVNYEKLKRAYLQYIGFVLSPLFFILTLILLNAFIAMFVSAMSSANIFLIPPLLNINSAFTVDNVLLVIAGAFMLIFAVIFILVVIILLLVRFLGGIIFAVGIFFYLSEDYKYRMFGRNLLIAFLAIYLAPLILSLLYAFWFGFMPMTISQAFGYGGLNTIASGSGSYSASVINATTIEITPGNISVSCNSGPSIGKALSTIGTNRDAVAVLIGGCQQYVGYWANGYIIMAFVSLVLLLLLIFGFGAIAGAIGGITGLGGGAGSVSIFSGLSGLPKSKIASQIIANMKENRSRYAQKLREQGGIMKTVGGAFKGGVKSTFGKAIKGGSMTENVAYGLVTAPIAGTALGNALDFTRQATKNIIAKTFEKPDTYAYGNADDVINAYLEKAGGKKPNETDEHAKERAKQELSEKYGIEFNNRTNTFKAKKKTIGQLETFTGKKIPVSYSSFNEYVPYENAKQEVEDAETEHSEAEKNYQKVEKAYKKGKATKEQLDQAKDRLNRAENRLISAYTFLTREEENLKDHGFENVKDYENKKSINDAYMQYNDAKKSGDKKKMKEAYNNLISTMQDVAKRNNVDLDVKKLTQMLKEDGTYADFQNILGTAFGIKGDSQDFMKFISQAVEGKREIALKRYLMNYGGNFLKAFNTELINPTINQLTDRYSSVKNILRRMKDYNIISAVDLLDSYNKDMQIISGTLGQLQSRYLEVREALSKATTKDQMNQYKAELTEISQEMQSLDNERKILEKSKNLVEAPALLTLSIFNKKTIEELKKMEAQGKLSELSVSLSNLSRLAHGDDLGRITLTKAMLENEARIKARTRETLEKELQKATKEMKTATTESQKMQLANTIKDLQTKLKITNNEYSTITENKNTIEGMLNELNAERKPIITNSKYTFEKEFERAIKQYIQGSSVGGSPAVSINKTREELANEIADLQNRAKTIINGNFKEMNEKTIRSFFDILSQKDLNNSAILKNLHDVYQDQDFEKLREILDENKEAREELAKYVSEDAKKLIVLKQKEDEQLYKQELEALKIDKAKLLYSTELKNSIKQESVKIDREIVQKRITAYLEANKETFGLDDNDAKILESFDSALFNMVDKKKQKILINIANDYILPEIEKMAHTNKYASVLTEKLRTFKYQVDNMQYGYSDPQEYERLEDLRTKEEMTNFLYNEDNIFKKIFGKKPVKNGDTVKKGTFQGRPIRYGTASFFVNQTESTNEDKDEKDDIDTF